MSREDTERPHPVPSTVAPAEANVVTLTHSKLEELPNAVHRRETPDDGKLAAG